MGPGGFCFSELAHAHPPLAHSIHASGLVNIFVYATELAPAHPPLAFAVTPPGGLGYVLRTSAMGSGGFCFYVGRPFAGAKNEAGKMTGLQVAKHNQRNGISGLR